MRSTTSMLNRHLSRILESHLHKCWQTVHRQKIQAICFQHEYNDQKRFCESTLFYWQDWMLSWFTSSNIRNNHCENSRNWSRLSASNNTQDIKWFRRFQWTRINAARFRRILKNDKNECIFIDYNSTINSNAKDHERSSRIQRISTDKWRSKHAKRIDNHHDSWFINKFFCFNISRKQHWQIKILTELI
jgi:hypothetical protein